MNLRPASTQSDRRAGREADALAIVPPPARDGARPAAPATGLAQRAGRPGAVTLRIDRLVIDGFALTPAQGARLQQALEQEFARLCARSAPGPTPVSATLPSLQASALAASSAASPSRLGRDAARSLYAALGRP